MRQPNGGKPEIQETNFRQNNNFLAMCKIPCSVWLMLTKCAASKWEAGRAKGKYR